MAKVKVEKGRATINNLPQGIEVIIPSKKRYFMIVFLSFWLFGWFFGELGAIKNLLDWEDKLPNLFMIVWLCGWTVGGAFAIVTWFYNVKGKEVVRIDGQELKYVRDFFLFKRSKEYDVINIKDLRVNLNSSNNNGIEYLGISGGTIAFDYGRSTHVFGTGLDEAEAKHIIQTIKNRYKNL
ncbi:hypothetical protein [Thiofilum flexile]|uniref:hypothetical protein n=1 Tax=Thiofilum flexile TaxID=125627 RepID=UPI0003703AC2|nr:hypothetical protein [Thiofilum flexile]